MYGATTILLLFSAVANAGSQADGGGNAALKYWQAFATLPQLTRVAEAELLEDCLTIPLDDKVRALVKKAEYALAMMRRGAREPRCDWGVGWADEGLANRLPYLDAGRQLASLACLHARLHFEEGQNPGALDDLIAAMAMGRHLSRDGSLPGILLGYEIERRMGETLALYLPKLDASSIKTVQKRLHALPAGGTLAGGVLTEQTLEIGWFVRKLKEAKDKPAVLTFLSQLWGREESHALLEDCGGTKSGIIKHTEELLAWFPELAKQMAVPLAEFQKEQARAAKKFADNPMYKKLAPAIIRCRSRQAQAEVRRTLLAAALAVQMDGRAALDKHPDPVTGGSFAYAKLVGGFELRSNWLPKGAETLVLTVGRRP